MTDERDLAAAAELLRQRPERRNTVLAGRIMASVQSRARPARTVRPRYGMPLVSMAAAAMLVFFAWRSYDSGGVRPTANSDETVVRFELVDPQAVSVALAGDFNGWNAKAVPLRRGNGAKAWTAEVRLPPGRFTYSFVIDGRRWVADPAAARAATDDFGAPSSVVVVPISKAGQ